MALLLLRIKLELKNVFREAETACIHRVRPV